MIKVFLIFAIGLSAGYYIGYSQGANGEPSIVARVMGRVGGRARKDVSNDIDAQMLKVEGGKPASGK